MTPPVSPQQVKVLPDFICSQGLQVSIHLGHCFWIKVEDEDKEDTQLIVEEFRAEGYQVGLIQKYLGAVEDPILGNDLPTNINNFDFPKSLLNLFIEGQRKSIDLYMPALYDLHIL